MPFTTAQFFGAFRQYNDGIWPGQLVLLALALFAVTACFLWRSHVSQRLVQAVLVLLWTFAGLVYHAQYFAKVTPAAYLFGALFVAGAIVLVAGRTAIPFGTASHRRMLAGMGIIAYALILYPAIGYAIGHRYPEFPTFGAPCPVVIFTLGLLVTVRPPIPAALVSIAAIWSAIATMGAIRFGVFEDFGLTAAAVLVVALAIRDRKTAGIRTMWGRASARPSAG